MSSYTEKIQNNVSKVAAKYIENIEDERTLKALVFEKDFENRDSLYLLSLYNIVSVMDNKNMEKIALELWTSQYDIKGGLMATSSVYKFVMDDNFRKPWDVLGDYLFTNWHNRKLDNFEHHLFQFQIWKKSMFSKFVIEGLFLTIFAIFFQYYLMKAIGAANIVDTSFSDYTATTDAQQDLLYSIFQNNAAIFYSSMQITIFLSFTSLCFPIKIILWYLFSYKTKRIFTFFH